MLPVKDKDGYKSKYQSQVPLMLHKAHLIGRSKRPGCIVVNSVVSIPMQDGVCARVAYVYHEFARMPPGNGFAIVTMNGMTGVTQDVRYPDLRRRCSVPR